MDHYPIANLDQLEWRRLHPLTILVDFIKLIGKYLHFIVILVVIQLIGGKGDRAEFWIQTIGLFGIATSVVRYFSLRYTFFEENLIIRSGILNKTIRTIPLANIQHIDIRRPILHRLLGLADLRIETASGSGHEGNLSALSIHGAHQLREEIFQKKTVTSNLTQDFHPEDPDLVWKAELSDLVLAGLTQNKALAIVAAGVGLILALYNILGRKSEVLTHLAERTATFINFSSPTFYILVGVLLIIAGWVLSIANTLLLYHGFALRSERDKLVLQFGLTTQVEKTIPLRRVQSLVFKSTLTQKILRLGRVEVHNAGIGSIEQHEGEIDSTSAVLCPLIRKVALSNLSKLVFREFDPDKIAWQKVHPKHILLEFLQGQIFLIFFSFIFGLIEWKLGLLIFIVFSLINFLYSKSNWKNLEWAKQEQLFMVKQGVLGQKILILHIGKIQSIEVEQGLFQRRYRLGSLKITTAGSESCSVVNLPLQQTIELLNQLCYESTATGIWTPDGV